MVWGIFLVLWINVPRGILPTAEIVTFSIFLNGKGDERPISLYLFSRNTWFLFFSLTASIDHQNPTNKPFHIVFRNYVFFRASYMLKTLFRRFFRIIIIIVTHTNQLYSRDAFHFLPQCFHFSPLLFFVWPRSACHYTRATCRFVLFCWSSNVIFFARLFTQFFFTDGRGAKSPKLNCMAIFFLQGAYNTLQQTEVSRSSKVINQGRHILYIRQGR